MISRSSELRLGPHTFTVVSNPQVGYELALEGREADSSMDQLTIRIRHDLAPSIWLDCLCHEVLHMAILMTHLAEKWAEDEQEEVVRALSPYLTQFVLAQVG